VGYSRPGQLSLSFVLSSRPAGVLVEGAAGTAR